MNALVALAEPEFAQDSLIRPNAHAAGLLVALYAVLHSIGVVVGLRSFHVGSPPDLSVWYLLGALNPLLSGLGGVWMLLGDARGKRLVVFSLALGLVFSVAAIIQAPVEELALLFPLYVKLMDVIFFASWAAIVYYFVVTSQYGPDPRRWRVVLSTLVTILAVGVVL